MTWWQTFVTVCTSCLQHGDNFVSVCAPLNITWLFPYISHWCHHLRDSDQCVYAPGQWKATLHNVTSHWPSAYTQSVPCGDCEKQPSLCIKLRMFITWMQIQYGQYFVEQCFCHFLHSYCCFSRKSNSSSVRQRCSALSHCVNQQPPSSLKDTCTTWSQCVILLTWFQFVHVPSIITYVSRKVHQR